MGTCHLPDFTAFNILLVEDNFSSIEIVREMLDSPLVHIEAVQTLSLARKTIIDAGTAWHCWVLDIDLGTKDNGLSLMQEHCHYPFIIVLSGLNNMRISCQAVQLGALDVFDKSPETSLCYFADSVFRAAVVGYLLQGKRSDYLPTFLALKNHIFTSAPQWAEYSCISLRYLERICEMHCGLSPRHVLPLYYFLFSSIYLTRDDDASAGFRQRYSHADRTFFRYCNKFVLQHCDSVYSFLNISDEASRKLWPAGKCEVAVPADNDDVF